MLIKKLGKKFSSFIKKPFLFKVQDLLGLITFKNVKISRFFILKIDAIPEKYNTRNSQILRFATQEDIPKLCLLENKPEMFNSWLERGERCVIAMDGETVVGYEWFSLSEFFIEERFCYKITIPCDSVYAYNAYIKEEYRLRGIWVHFKIFFKDWMKNFNKEFIITMIDYGNDQSMKTHARFGFKICTDILWIYCFGRKFFFEKKVDFEWPNIENFLIKISNKKFVRGTPKELSGQPFIDR